MAEYGRLKVGARVPAPADRADQHTTRIEQHCPRFHPCPVSARITGIPWRTLLNGNDVERPATQAACTRSFANASLWPGPTRSAAQSSAPPVRKVIQHAPLEDFPTEHRQSGS